jgi:hypothetical protein
MKHQRHLTREEFCAIRPRLARMRPRNIEAAYQVLVNAHTQSHIAHTIGVTQQSIGDAVNAVWRHYLRHVEQQTGLCIPHDWVKVCTLLPPDMAALVDQMEKSALAALKKDQR